MKSTKRDLVPFVPASDAQKAYLHKLLKIRKINEQTRALIIGQLANGMSRERARLWIHEVKSLPYLIGE